MDSRVGTDGLNLLNCEPRHRMALAWLSPMCPTLLCLVTHVVGMRPKKQVVGVYAGWVVAPMKNVQAVANRTAKRLIGGSMRPDSARAKAPIAAAILVAAPHPAAIRDDCLREQDVLEVDFRFHK